MAKIKYTISDVIPAKKQKQSPIIGNIEIFFEAIETKIYYVFS